MLVQSYIYSRHRCIWSLGWRVQREPTDSGIQAELVGVEPGKEQMVAVVAVAGRLVGTVQACGSCLAAVA